MQMDRMPAGPLGQYWGQTHAPLNCLVFILPFLIMYEIGVTIWGTDLLARTQLQQLLGHFGASGTHLSALLVVIVLLATQALSKRPWKLDATAVMLMFIESLVLSLPLLGLGIIGGRLNQAAAVSSPSLAASGGPVVQSLLAAVGAGIYEEFIFRLVAMNLLGLVLLDLLELKEDLGQVLAVVVSSVLFSLYHPQVWSPWQWWTFTYIFVAGCYLALIFMGRGLGVAVGTHIFYNLIVGLHRLDQPNRNHVSRRKRLGKGFGAFSICDCRFSIGVGQVLRCASAKRRCGCKTQNATGSNRQSAIGNRHLSFLRGSPPFFDLAGFVYNEWA